MKGKVLIIDNYDSFTYNIVLIVNELGYETDVFRNDKIKLEEVNSYDKIILSPGPGIPDEAGIVKELITRYAPKKKILGICLGEQAIGECFGGKLLNLKDVYHGISTPIKIIEEDSLFDGLDDDFQAGRYHSWVVSNDEFPDSLKVIATDDDGQIMAIAHKEYDVKGVQFHPESILTPQGRMILNNWLTK